MADEIKQVLSFNLGNSLESLTKLDAAMAKVGAQTNNLANALQRFNQTGGPAFGAIGPAASKNLAQAAQSAQRLSVSVETLSRVVQTQLIVRVMSQVRDAFRESFQAAVDFEQQLARTLTIADPGTTLQGLGDSVRRLSDELNVPLQAVAEGLQQTISNQIGRTTEEAERFLATAIRFAKTTGSTVPASVDLLSGALQSFGKDVSETEAVAGQFFKVIDLGRVSAEELANTFGRVGPQAAQLGISLEEIGSAVSATTLPGVRTSEALTQLRGIMTALVKPTEAMEAALQKLGFQTVEQGVQTVGFSGLLDQLAKSGDGTSRSFSQLFPNVRGLAGALTLGVQDLQTFATNIREVTAAGSDLNAKFLTATQTEAEKATKELNELSNFLKVEVGGSVVRATNQFFGLAGGAENVTDVLRSTGPVLLGTAGALLTLGIRSKFAGDQTSRLSKALGALGSFTFLAGGAASLGQFIGEKIGDAFRGATDAVEREGAKQLAAFRTQQEQLLKAATDADKERVASALKASQEISRAFNSQLANIAQSDQRLADGVDRMVKRIVGGRQKAVNELARAAEQSEDITARSQDRVRSLGLGAEDRRFDRSLRGLTDAQQVFRLTQRSSALAAEAANELASAADENAVGRALDKFGRAELLATSAERIAERTENLTLQSKAAGNLERLTSKQLAAEQQLQQLQQKRGPELGRQADAQQSIVDSLRDQQKILAENLQITDKEGNLLPADELAARAARRQSALAAIGDPELTFNVETGIQKLKTDLQQAMRNFRLEVPLAADLERVLGRAVRTPAEFAAGLTKAREEADKLRRAIVAPTADQEETRTLRRDIEAINTAADDTGRQLARVAGGPLQNTAGTKQAAQNLADFRTELERISQSSNVTDDDLRKLIAQLDKIRSFAEGGVFNQPGFSFDVSEFESVVVKLREIQQIQQRTKANPADVERLRALEAIINADPAGQFQTMSTALGTGATSAERINQQLTSGASAAERIKNALANIGPARTLNQAFGGPVHRFADGGLSRGTDTVPAMLSPGEFVMNARDSRRFFTQLSAMNAGITPAFRSEGGSVTNMGDIVINESKTPQATAREVIRAINRQTRGKAAALRSN